MKIILALLSVAAAGCGPIPVQVQSSKQEQSQRQSVKQEVANDLSADQQSAHQSESRQGTNSMPVIIICNTVSSPGGRCIDPNENGPIKDHINHNLKGATK